MYAVESDYWAGAADNRITRDRQDIQKLNCFTSSLMTNPFIEDTGQTLLNFATGVVLPTDIAEKLLKRTDKSHKQMDTCVEKHLIRSVLGSYPEFEDKDF